MPTQDLSLCPLLSKIICFQLRKQGIHIVHSTGPKTSLNITMIYISTTASFHWVNEYQTAAAIGPESYLIVKDLPMETDVTINLFGLQQICPRCGLMLRKSYEGIHRTGIKVPELEGVNMVTFPQLSAHTESLSQQLKRDLTNYHFYR